VSIDPRIKLLVGLGLVAVIPALQRLLPLAALNLILVLGLWSSRRNRGLPSPLRLGLPMVGLVFAVSAVSFDPATAALASLRLLGLLLAAGALFQSMAPEQFADGLRLFHLPYPLVFVVTTSLRYVPLISGRLKRIMEAQRCRGIDFRLRLRNLTKVTALLLPLLVQSFLLAEHLAMAMESRGFSRKGRSRRRRYRIQPLEYLLLGAVLGALGGLLWWDRNPLC